MEQNGDVDLEKMEPPPSILSSQGGSENTPTARRQRTNVVYSQLPEEPEDSVLKPIDYTFRGRHIEMMAIGNLLSN